MDDQLNVLKGISGSVAFMDVQERIVSGCVIVEGFGGRWRKQRREAMADEIREDACQEESGFCHGS